MEIDPRVAFYLKHQDQIEEWANLRKQVVQSAHDFFCALAPKITEYAKTVSAEVYYFMDDEPDTRWPGIYLRRSSWSSGDDTEDLYVGLEWDRNRADYRGAYIGVYCPVKNPIAELVRNALASYRSKGRFERSAHWAIWRYEKPTRSDYWEDLPSFGSELVFRYQSLFANVDPILKKVAQTELSKSKKR